LWIWPMVCHRKHDRHGGRFFSFSCHHAFFPRINGIIPVSSQSERYNPDYPANLHNIWSARVTSRWWLKDDFPSESNDLRNVVNETKDRHEFDASMIIDWVTRYFRGYSFISPIHIDQSLIQYICFEKNLSWDITEWMSRNVEIQNFPLRECSDWTEW
jgi:hypothetical protein